MSFETPFNLTEIKEAKKNLMERVGRARGLIERVGEKPEMERAVSAMKKTNVVGGQILTTVLSRLLLLGAWMPAKAADLVFRIIGKDAEVSYSSWKGKTESWFGGSRGKKEGGGK